MSTNAFDHEMNRVATGDVFGIERRARAMQAEHVQTTLFRPIAGVLGAVGRRWRAFVERREALSHLSQLDDRLLADIGLSRENLTAQLLEAETLQAASRGFDVEQIVGTTSEIAAAANTNRPARAA